jgi:hypothetical protein
MLASSPDARPDITQASPMIFQLKGLPAWLGLVKPLTVNWGNPRENETEFPN